MIYIGFSWFCCSQLVETLNMLHPGESHPQTIIAMPTRCTVTRAKGRKNSMTWIRGDQAASDGPMHHVTFDTKDLLTLFFLLIIFCLSTGSSIQLMHCSLMTLRSATVKSCIAGVLRKRGLRSSSLYPVHQSHTRALVSLRSTSLNSQAMWG